MDAQERPYAGGILSRIRENVPELLIRFMSRCPENQQENALLLLKLLMEDEKLSNFFAMKPLCVAILQNLSEKKKAQTLDIMMQTKIIEYRGIGGHEDGIDIFACYFRKEDIGPLQEQETGNIEYRKMLHVRKACMGLAFQMYQMEAARDGAGVQMWKRIAEDTAEVNEIRQEWIW